MRSFYSGANKMEGEVLSAENVYSGASLNRLGLDQLRDRRRTVVNRVMITRLIGSHGDPLSSATQTPRACPSE